MSRAIDRTDIINVDFTLDELSIIQIALTEWHRYVPSHYGDSYEPNRIELVAKVNNLFTHLRKGG